MEDARLESGLEAPKSTGTRAFSLSLPVLVLGYDAGNREFAEPAEIKSLSAQEAVLNLKRKVRPGDRLRLSLRIPRTFLLEKPLEVDLSGTVDDRPVGDGPESGGVRVLLDRSYRIQTAP